MKTIVFICCMLLTSICCADKASYESELALRKAKVQARKEEKARYRQASYMIRKYGYWQQYSYWHVYPYSISVVDWRY